MKQLLTTIHKFLPLIGLLVIVGAFILFSYASRLKQDIRNKAAVDRGRAVFIVSPENQTEFAKDTPVEISLAVSLQNISVDGFQIAAKLEGVRSSDLRFDPAQPPEGMRIMVSKLTSPTATPASELILSYITENPSAPYNKNGLVPLGTFRMTAPGDNKLDVFFDKTASKVTVHGTAEDVLEMDQNQYTYTFFTPPPPVTCILENPTVVASPSAQTATAGKSRTYDISITDNSSGDGCTKETYNILTTAPQGWQVIHADDMDIEPGKNAIGQVTVTSSAGSAAQDYAITFKARSITTPGLSAETRATYTVSADKPLQLIFKIKLAGVTDGKADGVKASIRFVKGDLDQIVSLIFRHIGDGIYQATASLTDPPASGPGYQIIVKGEKHVAKKFCKLTGQSALCRSFDSLTLPEGSDTPTVLDFTGLPLDPGDMTPQDGKVDRNDITKLRELMKKSCADLSLEDKLAGDFNYDGCVDTSDALLLRRALETRYDEN